jgi:uroporphyrinogen decarboxylase
MILPFQARLYILTALEIIQVFDSWAGELSPKAFKEFSLPYLIQIADELPKRLKELNATPVPMVVFAKGAWYALEDLCKSNYDIVGLDWLHNPADAYKVAQAHGKVLQGNADPGVLYGDRAAISDAVKTMVDGFGGGKQGWIANLGHGKFPRAVSLASIG